MRVRLAVAFVLIVVVVGGAAAFLLTRPVQELPARQPPASRSVANQSISSQPSAGQPQNQTAVDRRSSPSLRCLFSDYTHGSVTVGFQFAVTLTKGAPPRFAEQAQAVRHDPETVFGAGDEPIWSYAIDDGTKTITSPDGATRIVLYGLKLGSADTAWTEAGIRSNEFRNLDGRCLQSHFDRQ